MLQNDLDSARGGAGRDIEGVKDRFPRSGAMGLLESHPELIDRYSALAHRFVNHGYLAPMNVLWTYYFINGMREEAMGVWERYVKDCPQIMFQKVCQTARSRNSLQVSQPVFVTVTIRYCDNRILLGFHSEVLGLVADTKALISSRVT